MSSSEEINIIKGILNARCREGATVEDIQDDFTEFIGKPWQMAGKSLDVIKNYMNSIDGAYGIETRGASIKWYVRSDETVHIKKLIQQQRRSTEHSPTVVKKNATKVNANKTVATVECFFKDNYAYKYKRYRVKSLSDSYDSQLHDKVQLLGDDFFLSIQTTELGYPLTRNKPHQSGLAKSGLSIRGAINLLQSIAFFKTPSIVINVGSIDIMLGRNLVDMQSDYNELVDLCEKRNIQPIITTLAPLANSCHSRDIRNKLLKFNSYLRDKFYSKYRVINLWSQFVTPRGRTCFEYFEPESVYVTGSTQAHVLWNKIGRQIILDHIKMNL